MDDLELFFIFIIWNNEIFDSMSYKQVLCVLLSLSTALNTFAADKFEVGGLYYSIISEENKTVKVEAQTSQIGTDNYANLTNCIIPSTIQYSNTTYSVTEIAYNAFNNAPNLISVTIPVSITKIEDVGIMPEWNAFYNSLKLNSFSGVFRERKLYKYGWCIVY